MLTVTDRRQVPQESDGVLDAGAMEQAVVTAEVFIHIRDLFSFLMAGASQWIPVRTKSLPALLVIMPTECFLYSNGWPQSTGRRRPSPTLTLDFRRPHSVELEYPGGPKPLCTIGETSESSSRDCRTCVSNLV